MLELPTVSPWRTSTNCAGPVIASGLHWCGGVVERVEHQASQQLGIEVGRFFGHYGARIADRLDVADRRRIHQEGATGAARPDASERGERVDGVFDKAARLYLLGRDLEDS